MTRRRRTLAACFAAFALAFAQLAVSAHACEALAPATQEEQVVHPVGCAGTPLDAGDLVCEQHCQYGEASVDSNPSAPLAMHVQGPVLKVEFAPAPLAASPPSSRSAVPAIATPPPAILFGVLRI